jgi:hypothetical protein
MARFSILDFCVSLARSDELGFKFCVSAEFGFLLWLALVSWITLGFRLARQPWFSVYSLARFASLVFSVALARYWWVVFSWVMARSNLMVF